MLTELNVDTRASVRRLFDHYPCLHGCIAAILEGGMGKVFADLQEEPRAALAILGFQFLAGDPLDKSAPRLLTLLKPGWVIIAPTLVWQQQLAARYPGELEICEREAFQTERFDIQRLKSFCSALPEGFELRQLRAADVAQFNTDLYDFLSGDIPEEFFRKGVAMGILYQGKFVSGAYSAGIGGGKLEIDILTVSQFRRRGLAKAVAAAIILHCLDRGLEPCWDAANERSSALARQLGFRPTHQYLAYILKP